MDFSFTPPKATAGVADRPTGRSTFWGAQVLECYPWEATLPQPHQGVGADKLPEYDQWVEATSPLLLKTPARLSSSLEWNEGCREGGLVPWPCSPHSNSVKRCSNDLNSDNTQSLDDGGGSNGGGFQFSTWLAATERASNTPLSANGGASRYSLSDDIISPLRLESGGMLSPFPAAFTPVSNASQVPLRQPAIKVAPHTAASVGVSEKNVQAAAQAAVRVALPLPDMPQSSATAHGRHDEEFQHMRREWRGNELGCTAYAAAALAGSSYPVERERQQQCSMGGFGGLEVVSAHTACTVHPHAHDVGAAGSGGVDGGAHTEKDAVQGLAKQVHHGVGSQGITALDALLSEMQISPDPRPQRSRLNALAPSWPNVRGFGGGLGLFGSSAVAVQPPLHNSSSYTPSYGLHGTSPGSTTPGSIATAKAAAVPRSPAVAAIHLMMEDPEGSGDGLQEWYSSDEEADEQCGISFQTRPAAPKDAAVALHADGRGSSVREGGGTGQGNAVGGSSNGMLCGSKDGNDYDCGNDGPLVTPQPRQRQRRIERQPQQAGQHSIMSINGSAHDGFVQRRGVADAGGVHDGEGASESEDEVDEQQMAALLTPMSVSACTPVDNVGGDAGLSSVYGQARWDLTWGGRIALGMSLRTGVTPDIVAGQAARFANPSPIEHLIASMFTPAPAKGLDLMEGFVEAARGGSEAAVL